MTAPLRDRLSLVHRAAAIGTIVSVAMVLILLIFGLVDDSFSEVAGEILAALLVIVSLCALVLGAASGMRQREGDFVRRFRRGCIGAAIASIVLIAIVSLIGFARNEIEESSGRVLMSLMVIVVASLMLLGAATVFSQRRSLRALAGLAAAFAVLSAVLWFVAIWWWDFSYGAPFDLVVELGVTASLATLGLTLSGLLLTLRTRSVTLNFARYGLILLLALTLALYASFVWELLPIETAGGGGPSGAFLFFALPFTGLTLVGLFIVPLLFRVLGRGVIAEAETIPTKLIFRMSCPECGEMADYMNGAARCDACGFRMMIEVEEPRCECGYLLYRLEGEVCPECGREIPEDQKWRAGS